MVVTFWVAMALEDLVVLSDLVEMAAMGETLLSVVDFSHRRH